MRVAWALLLTSGAQSALAYAPLAHPPAASVQRRLTPRLAVQTVDEWHVQEAVLQTELEEAKRLAASWISATGSVREILASEPQRSQRVAVWSRQYRSLMLMIGLVALRRVWLACGRRDARVIGSRAACVAQAGCGEAVARHLTVANADH